LSAAFDSKLDKVGEIFELQQLKLSGTPASWPVRGSITDRFGWRFSPFGRGSESHSGLDISASFGAPVQATADGHVVYAGPQGGYGNLIEIDHGFGLATRYGHLSRISVRIGDHVNRGSMIGAVGTTGRSTGPHCHYEVRLHGVPVNPSSTSPKTTSHPIRVATKGTKTQKGESFVDFVPLCGSNQAWCSCRLTTLSFS
jgi:murein DD-endopeptidase MepM/ murein hydrolase activator NlpD